MAKEDTQAKIQIAYVPWATFNAAIEALEHTMPPRLDKTMWPSYSGAIQSQLWSAFRFLDLIRDDGTPTDNLVRLVKDKLNRKAFLRDILEEHYPSLFEIDLSKTTLGHFNETMRGYGLGTETQKKASSFFLQAAKAAGVELSSFLLKNTRTPGLRKKGQRKKAGGNGNDQSVRVMPTPSIGGPVKTITLDNDITLSISTSADTFRMSAADRKFVLELLERLEEYEMQSQDEEGERVEIEPEEQEVS